MKTLHDGTEVSLDTPTRLVSGKRYLLSEVSTQPEKDERLSRELDKIDKKPHIDALKEISRLEVTITTRRLREALLTAGGKTWLADIETLIEVERAKLNG